MGLLERMHSNVRALDDPPVEAAHDAAAMQPAPRPTKRVSRARKARTR